MKVVSSELCRNLEVDTPNICVGRSCNIELLQELKVYLTVANVVLSLHVQEQSLFGSVASHD